MNTNKIWLFVLNLNIGKNILGLSLSMWSSSLISNLHFEVQISPSTLLLIFIIETTAVWNTKKVQKSATKKILEAFLTM